MKKSKEGPMEFTAAQANRRFESAEAQGSSKAVANLAERLAMNVSTKRVVKLVLIALVLLAPGLARAQAPASANAYATTGDATANGSTANLEVQSPSTNTYILFNLGALPSGLTASGIEQGILKLYVHALPTPGTVVRVPEGCARSSRTRSRPSTIRRHLAGPTPGSTRSWLRWRATKR